MRSRGFTLVELLVALFALALLAMLSWRGLDGMMRAQAYTEARADEVQTLQTGMAQWTADLDALVQLPQMSALEWNGRVLRLTRRGTTDATEGLRVVAWARREGQWRRWQSGPLTTRGAIGAAWDEADQWSQNPGDAQRRGEVVVLPLEDWQLFYFRGDAWTNPLSSDAPRASQFSPDPVVGPGTARQAGVAPDGVRLVLQMPPGSALAGRITRDWVSPTVAGGKS